jgi:uncharacterized protein (DUF302 family)
MRGLLPSLVLVLSWGAVPVAGLAVEFSANTASWPHQRLVRRVSLDDVQATMDRLETLVLERGLELYGRINLGADARKAGVKLTQAESLAFGNPNTLGLVMSHDARAGLELPLKMLVYEADDGNTWLEYREPLSLRQEYRLDKCTAMEELSQLMAELAEVAVDGRSNGR